MLIGIALVVAILASWAHVESPEVLCAQRRSTLLIDCGAIERARVAEVPVHLVEASP